MAESEKSETSEEILERACKFYCDWYDGTAHEGLTAGAVAYELVSSIRQALAGLAEHAADR